MSKLVARRGGSTMSEKQLAPWAAMELFKYVRDANVTYVDMLICPEISKEVGKVVE